MANDPRLEQCGSCRSSTRPRLGTGSTVGQDANADTDTRVWKLRKFLADGSFQGMSAASRMFERLSIVFCPSFFVN